MNKSIVLEHLFHFLFFSVINNRNKPPPPHIIYPYWVHKKWKDEILSRSTKVPLGGLESAPLGLFLLLLSFLFSEESKHCALKLNLLDFLDNVSDNRLHWLLRHDNKTDEVDEDEADEDADKDCGNNKAGLKIKDDIPNLVEILFTSLLNPMLLLSLSRPPLMVITH